MRKRIIVMLLGFGAAVFGQQPDIHLVLSKAARIPGSKLKAGRYTVHVLESLQDRFILQVTGEKNSRPLATFLAIPEANLPHQPSGQPVFWKNGAHDSTIRGLWFDQLRTGAQFVYEKDEAAKLAKSLGQPVPAVDPDSEGLKPLAKMTDADRQIVTLWLLSAVAVTPDGKETGIQAAKFVPETQVAQRENRNEVAARNSEVPPAQRNSTANAAATRVPMRMPSTAGHAGAQILLGICFLSSGTLLMRKLT